MKKTKIGQGRKLLLRGEVLARLEAADLEHVAGGGDVGSGTIPTQCSHPPSLGVKS